MRSVRRFWIDTWLLLTSLVCSVNSANGTRKEIPYEVVFPPGSDGESLPPIVMLHGLLDWRKTWLKMAPDIAKKTGRKLYMYDSTNHGENEWNDAYHLTALELELEQFLQQCNITKAVIVAHSLGGKTAMIFSLRKPEMVEKLILEDISPRKATPKVYSFIKQALLASRVALAEIISGEDEKKARETLSPFMQKIFSIGKNDDLGTEFLTEWMPITKRGDRIEWMANIGLINRYANTKKPDEWDPGLSGVFDGDVLFIYGARSLFNVASDELIQKHFPRAEMIEIKEGRHFLHFQFPNEVGREISNFVNKKNDSD